jgi:quercetin dioxygenase-like cupin family protein
LVFLEKGRLETTCVQKISLKKMGKNATKTFNIMKGAFKKQQTIKKHTHKF